MKEETVKFLNLRDLSTESFLAIWLYQYKFLIKEFLMKSMLLVARGLPRDTENIPVYWKNFTSGLSFTVSILGQHFWSALGSAFATSSSRHQGGSYNSKTSLSA